MTDKELLELAAKAAGYQIDGPASKYMVQGYTFDSLLRLNEQGGHSVWNPLNDDGDALKLAVKLNLRLVHHPVLNQVLVRPYHSNEWGDEAREDCENHPDPYAATRRAIVRAAAEIGKAMP